MDSNKLDFIRKGCIVRGINLESFQAHLAKKKENGALLSNWSMLELKEV
jgi:hypothetical protein